MITSPPSFGIVRRAIAGLFWSAAGLIAGHAKPVAVTDLFRTVHHHQIELSPDGKYVVTVFPHSQERGAMALGMAVTDLDSGQSSVLHRDRNISVIRAQWAGDSRLFTSLLGGYAGAADPAVRIMTQVPAISASQVFLQTYYAVGGYYLGDALFLRYGLYAVNADGSELKEFARPGRSEESLMSFVELVATHTGTADEILVMREKAGARHEKKGWHYGGHADLPGVYRLNVRTGATAMVLRDPGRTRKWFADPSGRVRVSWGLEDAMFDSDGWPRDEFLEIKSALFWIDDDGSAVGMPGVLVEDDEAFVPLGFERGGERFLFCGRQGRDRAAVWAWNPAERRVEGPLVEHEQFDLREAVRSPHDGTIAGVIIPEGNPRIEWFDPELRTLHASINSAIPGRMNTITHWSRDYQRVLIRSFAIDEPDTYRLLDRKARSLGEIYRPASWLSHAQFGRGEPVSFTARDGETLHGYLTRPRDAQAGQALPTVLYAAGGGPWGRRVSATFDPTVQFFVTRGYAVLQVNPRGLGGYGRRMMEKARASLDKMPDDLADAVDWAVAQGHAASGRWIAAGENYGGYAVTRALADRPEQFRAGVALWPLADPAQVLKDLRTYRGMKSGPREIAWWAKWTGDPEKDRTRLESAAIATHAGRIRVPVFVGMASLNADRVDQRQSAAFSSALSGKGVKVVKFSAREVKERTPLEEYHIQTFTALEKFLREHAKAGF